MAHSYSENEVIRVCFLRVFCGLWLFYVFEKCWLFCRMCLAKMSTCNLSDLASSFCKNTSSHDSHTEVHQPSSIRKSMTSHHTSSGHHLYEGDLVSKTSNLNEASISSNWGLGLGFSGRGGRQKKINSCPIPRALFLRPWQCWVNIGSMLSMPGLVQPDFM